jgi:hypothetical protein
MPLPDRSVTDVTLRSVLCAFALAVSAGCSICTPVTPDTQFLCGTASGGVGVEVRGGNERYEGLACQVSTSGTGLTFTVTGTQCSIATTAPMHASGSAPCDLSAIPPGTYTTLLSGTPATIVVPPPADAGWPDCP